MHIGTILVQLIFWRIFINKFRYIATEAGKSPPVTRCRKVPELPDFGVLYTTSPFLDIAPSFPGRQFLRLFEASNLLDKVHIALNDPTRNTSFHLEEVLLTVKTLISFHTVLQQETPKDSMPHACGLLVCLM